MTERSLVGNAADKEQVDAADKQEKLDRLEFITLLRNAVARPDVRRVFWKYLERCGVFELSYREGRPDATTFHEGERNIGLMIQADWIEADEQAYLAAMIDNKRREELRKR